MRRTIAAMLFICAALLLAACGGGSSSTSTSEPSGGSSEESPSNESTGSGGSEEEGEEASGDAAQEKAAAAVAQYLKAPTKIWISTPLPETPPTGKTVDVLDCAAPACTAWAEATIEGAEALGWTGKRITEGTSPQQITAAWNQVVRDPPDAVASVGIPKSLFGNQLKELTEKEIPVLNGNVAEPSEEGNEVIEEGIPGGEKAGAIWAQWIVSQKGEEANVLNVTSPEFPITASYTKGFETEYSKLCPECKVQEVGVSASEIGSGANTTAIIGALRSNPDINYIMGVDDLMTGLPAALKTAGLSEQVEIVGKAPGPTEYAYLEEEGPYKATIVYPAYEEGWQMIDWLARHFIGASTKPAEAEYPPFLMTAETVKPNATSFYPFISSFEEEFKKLWKVE
jgi:ABC-type sugar transport system substrate-binding protein